MSPRADNSVRFGYATEARGGVGDHSAPRACARATWWRLAAWLLLSVLGLVPPVQAQSASVGAIVRNVATVDFSAGGVPRSVATNEATLRVAPAPSRATIALARFVGPDGKVRMDVKIDLVALKALSSAAREKYGLGSAVQHGASTLNAEAFEAFPRAGACEIHLATNFQHMVYDHPKFPAP